MMCMNDVCKIYFLITFFLGSVFLQSDVLRVARSMRDVFEMHALAAFELAPEHSGKEEDVFFSTDLDCESEEKATENPSPSNDSDGHGKVVDAAVDSEGLQNSVWASWGWLRQNPIGVPTEREHHVLSQGLPVYRVLLLKRR
jgi:hypothetical protein